jgi:very-short-patch-repair endonuclease
MAAVLACGPGAALSHRSAAHLWGLRSGHVRTAVTVPRERAGARNLEIHRCRAFDPADFSHHERIRVTSVARTLLDIAAIVSPLQLARAVDRAERTDLFDLVAIEELLLRANGHRGVGALRRAVAAWSPRYTRSELEDRFQDLLQAAPLPGPVCNVLVQGAQHTHEVDTLWADHQLVVQLDGFAYHRTRRDRARDAATDADLELAGYRVVHLTWDDVTIHRERTLRRLGLLLLSDT